MSAALSWCTSLDLGDLLMYCSVGWRCEWFEVYAWPLRRPRRSERRIFFSNEMSSYSRRAPHSSAKANILINKDRQTYIADLGLTTVTGAVPHASVRASRVFLIPSGTLMSFTARGPELLDPERFGMPESEGNRPTRPSDCYVLEMVVYEVGVRASGFFLVNI